MFKTINDFVQRLRVIFYAIIGAPLSVFLMLFLQYREGKEAGLAPAPELISVFQIVVPVVCLAEVIAVYIILSKRLKEIRAMKGGLPEKLPAYLNYSIIKYAMYTGGGILAIVAYYLTAHPMMAVLYLLMLVAVAKNNPSTFNILNDLRLPQHEEDLFNDGKIE